MKICLKKAVHLPRHYSRVKSHTDDLGQSTSYMQSSEVIPGYELDRVHDYYNIPS